jgi:ribonuclease Z
VDFSARLSGFSKALYSNWLLYKPDALLVDCGEGCATALGNGVYAVERILLTHGHIDHTGGLASFIWARHAARGDAEKPLEIYYPEGDPYVADLRGWLESVTGRIKFPLTWTPLRTGETIELSASERHARTVETFATNHMDSPTLGYKIVETRRRLKPEFAALEQAELQERARNGGNENFSENYHATLIAFGGDGLAIAPEPIWHAEILVHEATILDAADRKSQKHATLEEAMRAAQNAEVQTLIINHVSGRYSRDEVVNATRECATRLAFEGKLWLLLKHRWIEVER